MLASIIVVLAVVTCLIADWIWLWFGRRWGSRATQVLCKLAADPRKCSRDAHEKFHRYGSAGLVFGEVSSWSGCRLAASRRRKSVTRGLLRGRWDRELALVSFLRRAGLCFLKSARRCHRLVSRFGAALAIAIGVPIVLYAGWRGIALLRMIQRLRVCRISPSMLHRKPEIEK